MKVENNKVVSFHYTLTLANGEAVDSSVGRDPLSIIVGAQQIIPGLEKELIGMEVGDTKDVVVQPEEGYGQKRDDLIHIVEKERIPNGNDLQVGETIRAQGSGGDIFEGQVIETDADKVKIDFNHPLAGEVLNFATEIVEVRAATEEELAHGHVH